jgi:hypothetical protein
MNINFYSLFSEIEWKQVVFEATLELYRREAADEIFRALDEPTAGIGEITALFDIYVANASQQRAKFGCSACNTATERASHDAATHDRPCRFPGRCSACGTSGSAAGNRLMASAF